MSNVPDYGNKTQEQILSNAEGVSLIVHARRMKNLGDTAAARALTRGKAKLVRDGFREACLYYTAAIDAMSGAVSEQESTDGE